MRHNDFSHFAQGYYIQNGGVQNYGILIMSGDAKIQDCVSVNTYTYGAKIFGGGVCNRADATFIMKDNSSIQNCHTKIVYAHENSRNGGGVYNEGTFQMLDNSLISGCTADKEKGGLGGAVYNVHNNDKSVFKADGGTIEGDVYNSNKLDFLDNHIAVIQNTTDGTATIIYGDVVNDGKIEGSYLTTFMANGKPFAYEIRKSGQNAIKPKDPTLPYGTFKDWYKDEETTIKYDFTKETINEATTIYAGWNYTDYTVSFDTKGGSTTIADKTVIWTDKVLNGETPERAGYRFDGWSYKGKSVGVDTTYGNLAPVMELKITLTAKWSDIADPTIGGIENGKTYCSAQTVTVSDNEGIASVTVNGKSVTLTDGKFTLSPAEGEQTIVVKDNAGNIATMKATVNDGHEGGTATCTKKAVCEHCGLEYGEVDATNHTTLKHIEAKAATTEAEGNIEYWHCEDCDKYFSDKDCKNEITLADTVLPKLSNSEVPKTGDGSRMVLWLALALLSSTALAAAVACGRKKKFTAR